MEMVKVTCPHCKYVATFESIDSHTAVGCTYDCACGRVLVIEDQEPLVAVDLHEHMGRHLKERFNIDTTPADWGVIELSNERDRRDDTRNG